MICKNCKLQKYCLTNPEHCEISELVNKDFLSKEELKAKIESLDLGKYTISRILNKLEL